MSRPAKFTQADVQRAIKAAMRAAPDYGVVIDPATGLIEIRRVALTEAAPPIVDEGEAELARYRAKRDGKGGAARGS